MTGQEKTGAVFQKELSAAIEGIDEDRASQLIREALAEGMAPDDIMAYLRSTINRMIQKYEDAEYYIADLIITGEIVANLYKIVRPKGMTESHVGKIVIGTVCDDIHEMGKNIFISLAKSAGFSVIDLGINVPAETFAQAVRKEKPDILGVSAVLTTTRENVMILVKTLIEEGLRDSVKVIFGGSAATPDCMEWIGCDACTQDAVEGLTQCIAWMQELKEKD